MSKLHPECLGCHENCLFCETSKKIAIENCEGEAQNE
jgi:hypothetical protein